jgi:hypothetical protein
MKLDKIANIIIEADKFESKKRFKNEDEFKENVNKFIDSINSKLVKLKLTKPTYKETSGNQHWNFSFQIIFVLDDPYINSKAYQSGSVFIFPSEKLFKDLDKLSMNLFTAYPQWDESKTTATITGHAKVY